jgi:hypothetical protein
MAAANSAPTSARRWVSKLVVVFGVFTTARGSRPGFQRMLDELTTIRDETSTKPAAPAGSRRTALGRTTARHAGHAANAPHPAGVEVEGVEDRRVRVSASGRCRGIQGGK